jgi:regulator of protease activity HflC (stomatin/prohibitin superfamily)
LPGTGQTFVSEIEMDAYWSHVLAARVKSRGIVVVYEHERGLLYRAGVFQRVLEPGRYRLWWWSRKSIRVVDVRLTTVSIANQKLLTSDQITVTVNLSVSYRISDAAAAVNTVADCVAQLYSDVQLAARNAIGAATLDEVIADRGALGGTMRDTAASSTASYGVALESVGLKDIILSAKMRDVLAKEIEAKRIAQAMLLAAREEVAALRAMANAARMLEEHPGLLRLRELETVRSVAQAGGNTVVMGVGSTPGVGVTASGGLRATEQAPVEVEDEG